MRGRGEARVREEGGGGEGGEEGLLVGADRQAEPRQQQQRGAKQPQRAERGPAEGGHRVVMT